MRSRKGRVLYLPLHPGPPFLLDPECRCTENSGQRISKEHRVGKGDKRTFRGKVFKGSHGKTRPRKAKKKAKKPA